MGASPRLVTLALIQPVMLIVAWLFGELVRRLLRRRVLVSGTTMAVVSFFGMCVGALVVGLLLPDQEIYYPTTLAAIFAVDAAVIAGVSTVIVAYRIRTDPPPTLADLVAAGESDQVEFKSTARVNLRTGQRDDRMELVVAKTVAAFLNAAGGTLVIGVDDDGTPLGLDADLATVKQPDADRFELWLRDHLQSRLGMPAASLAHVDFDTLGDDALLACRITCPPSTEPVYLRPAKGAAPELWVRVGNSTRGLDVDDAVRYVQRRFPAVVSRAALDRFVPRSRRALKRIADRTP